ncbi:VF530 family protein [Teredinibacter purpureus]|uniref:VF530 family protein n=1 Tax=Teredinibacter purpureus TaxID=2731756 RepID=UPI0005F7DC89|nr:VF530 family protein [Teredinibacter purpureus]
MKDKQKLDPLHGVTLEKIVTHLVEHYGWKGLAERINLNCFKSNPSVKSSLTFLRKTLWAREKVEELYVATVKGSVKESAKSRPKDAKQSTPPTSAPPFSWKKPS